MVIAKMRNIFINYPFCCGQKFCTCYIDCILLSLINERIKDQYLDYMYSELLDERAKLMMQAEPDPVRIQVLNDMIQEGKSDQPDFD